MHCDILYFSGFLIHICLLCTMFFWTPTTRGLFAIAAVWGVADGIFVTQIISKPSSHIFYLVIRHSLCWRFFQGLIAVLFMDKKESAFAGLKMCQAVAVTIFFIFSPYLCTKYKIVSLAFTAVAALVGYWVLETKLNISRAESRRAMEVLSRIGPTSV